ncbi:MAG TPA: dynamin family protein [Gammaproteobacteria bacterium]
MAGTTKASLKERIKRLEAHLHEENPELLGIVQSFRRLDAVAYRLGLLDDDESYAAQVSWWPLIAVLGTYSSGKSTFINSFLGRRLQLTGNQAVDDKFTVICYGRDATSRLLPGLALDNDPRFPFYQISGEIDEMLEGDDLRLDSYLQLKTTDSEAARGKIIIDSPGFDADDQRTATLRITSHIIDLSDLVLVFFDARHPEPGAMRDTLEYLVGATLRRPDFNKFLYILNQIDNAAREDNPEEVFAAWQRALAQKGLTAGRFYQIYDAEAAVPIENEHLRRRFESKREQDTSAILERVRQLEVERAYRVAGKLEQTAELICDRLVPRLEAARRAWKRRMLWLDGILLGTLVAVLLFASFAFDWWDGARFAPPWLDFAVTRPFLFWGGVVLLLAAVWLLHRLLRQMVGQSVLKRLRSDASLGDHAARVARAFEKNLRAWRPYLFTRPRGWTAGTRKRLNAVLDEAHAAIQRLNDRYTDPSGRREEAAPAEAAAVEQAREPAQGEQRANGEQREGDAWPPPAPRRRAFFGRRSGGAAVEQVAEDRADDRA